MKDNTKELFKEASDIINELIEEVSDTRKRNQELENDLQKYKEASEREQIAKILEERSLTSMAKIASLRDGTISKTELEKLKIVADSNLIESTFEHSNSSITKVAEEREIPDYTLEAMEARREQRAELLYNSLQQMSNR